MSASIGKDDRAAHDVGAKPHEHGLTRRLGGKYCPELFFSQRKASKDSFVVRCRVIEGFQGFTESISLCII